MEWIFTMKLRKDIIIVFSTLIIVFLISVSTAHSMEISVGLSTNVTSLRISSSSSLVLIDKMGNRSSVSRSSVFTKRSSDKVQVNNKNFLLPVKIYSKSLLTYDKRKYRGYFQILNSKRGMTLTNRIELEQYLRGVLKMEVNPGWPMESLKAQAIISRTYAIKHKGRHAKDGFDICAKPHCQVYRGVNAEDSTLDRAIKQTDGMILKYGNDIASTFFHSDSGGATANVATVWSSSIPYLKGSKEPFNYKSPYSDWQVKLSCNDIQRASSRVGKNVGTVTGIRIYEKDPFGRVNKILVKGTNGKTIIKAHTFRMAVGAKKLKSTFFTIDSEKQNRTESKTFTVNTQELPAPELSFIDEHSLELNSSEEKLMTVLTKQGYFNSKEMIDMLLNPSTRKKYLLKAVNRKPPKRDFSDQSPSLIDPENNSFTFHGNGWGHGVGLSQWGARNLAQRGWKARRILEHYFPGTRLEKIY